MTLLHRRKVHAGQISLPLIQKLYKIAASNKVACSPNTSPLDSILTSRVQREFSWKKKKKKTFIE